LHKSDYVVDGVPIINPMHIIDGKLAPTSSMTVSESAAKRLGQLRLRPGEVVIGRRGDMGRCAVVGDEHAGWLCGTGSMIVRPSPRMDPGFLQFVLSSPVVVAAIEAASVGSTMVNLNQATLAGLAIQAPPRDEQAAISTAIADADSSLTKLDQLIAKKRDLKQAAMQQLLTGRLRLQGFTGRWDVRSLASFGSLLKGRGVTRDQANSGPIACVRYGEIYTTHHDIVRVITSWISPAVAATATRLKRGDILFAGSGETKEEIGKCVAFIDDFDAYAGGDIVILRPRGVDSHFLGYALNTPEVNRQKANFGQGDAVVHISAAALGAVTVRMPPLDEQVAIGTVLADMDAELAALEARRNKTHQLKQGMMQALLTGRFRLT